jgi:exopolysaccharide production protein ExoQ
MAFRYPTLAADARGVQFADSAALPMSAETSAIDRALTTFLLVSFLLYIFVGTAPMDDPDPLAITDGNSLDRLATLALAGLGCLVIARNARTALAIARRSWLLLLLLGWIALSVVWSDFPGLTLRRAVATIFMGIACFAIAVGSDSLRRVVAVTAVVLTVVILANVAVFVAVPSFAITDLGVRGFYQQKNEAGLVAMLALIFVGGWIGGREGLGSMVLGGVLIAIIAVFLVLTQSKTSLGLSVLCAMLVPVLMISRRVGFGSSALSASAVIVFSALVALLVPALQIDIVALVAASGGDITFTGRDELWSFVQAEIARRPLTGFGYGAFWDVGVYFDPLLRSPPGSWLSHVEFGTINQAHSGYLELLVQLGIPGFTLALLAVFHVLWLTLRRYFTEGMSRAERSATATFVLILGVILLHNTMESSLYVRGASLASVFQFIAFLACGLTAREAMARRGVRP